MLLIIIMTSSAILLLLLSSIIINKMSYNINYNSDIYTLFCLLKVLGYAFLTVALIMWIIIWGISSHAKYTRIKWEEERHYLIETYNNYQEYFEDDIASLDTIATVRKEIYKFNSNIKTHKLKCNNIWYGYFYIDPDYITPIIFIEDKAQ